MTDQEPEVGEAVAAPPTRSLGHNISVLLGSQVTTWLLSSALLVLVPRWLGPVAVGQLRVSQSLWAIVFVITAWGTGNYLTVEVARNHAQTRPLKKAVVTVRMWLFVVALPFVAVFMWLAGYERTVVVIVAISAVATMLNLIATADRAALFGVEQMSTVARVDVLSEVAMAGLVIVTVAIAGTAISFVIVVVVVGLLTAVLFRSGIRRLIPPTDDSPTRTGFGLLRACAPFLFADAAIVVYLQVDTLVISLIATEQDVGYYATADTIFGSLLFVPAVLMNAVFPRMARIHNERPEDLAKHVLQAFNTVMMVGFWIGLSTVVVSYSVTDLLFGPNFAGTAPVLAVFGVVCILGYQTILLGQYAIATDRARFVGFVVLASAILSIPLDLVLVRWSENRYGNGAIGAALAYIVTEGMQVVAGLLFLAPHLLCRRTGLRFARCLVAGAAMLVAAWPLRHEVFVLPGVVATVVYFAVLWLLRTPDEFERDLARRSWSKVRGRLPNRRQEVLQRIAVPPMGRTSSA